MYTVTKNHALLFAVVAGIQAVIALWYDWSVLTTVPPILLPLIAVCPLYALLLCICWAHYAYNRIPHPALVSISSIPAIGFGLLAPVFFGSTMWHLGFNLLSVGQILWVLAYAFPAAILSSSVPKRWRLVGMLWFAASMITHLITSSSGYFNLNMWSFETQLQVTTLSIIATAYLTLTSWLPQELSLFQFDSPDALYSKLRKQER